MPVGILQIDGLSLAEWLRIAADLAIVWFLVYRGLSIIRGTRAAPMLLGLSIVVALFFLSQAAGLVTLSWLLENVLGSLIIIVVVLFQDEIRRTLTKVGQYRLLRARTAKKTVLSEEVASSIVKLAEKYQGALLVLQGEIGLDEIVGDGTTLGAHLDRKLIQALFQKDSPLHDGAVVIEGEIIRAAGCVLPLSSNPDLDPLLGTRHRAALGLSERCDALIIVVSEENGKISAVRDGEMVRNLTGERLKDLVRRFQHGELGSLLS